MRTKKYSTYNAVNADHSYNNSEVPDVAFIHMGTEDIISGSGTAESLTDQMIDNIAKVIKSLRSKT